MVPRDFKCPYFMGYRSGKPISCECAKIELPDKQSRADLLDTLCGNGDAYLECPFYKVLDRYYKRKYDLT